MTDRICHEIVIEGRDAFDVPLAILRRAFDAILEGAGRSARLFVEGRSVARGTKPAWIESVLDVRLVEYREGSTAFTVASPPLVAAAPDQFAQRTIFQNWRTPDASAVDLFLEGIVDAAAGNRESDRLDNGVLEAIENLASTGLDEHSVIRVHRRGAAGVDLDRRAKTAVHSLAVATKPSAVKRVRGVLDTLTISNRAFVLRMPSGGSLRGFAGEVPIEELKRLHGEDVVVEGEMSFRPSGAPTRIEVDYVAKAKGRDQLWEDVLLSPRGAATTASDAERRGLEALVGSWPGDETDEEIFAILRENS